MIASNLQSWIRTQLCFMIDPVYFNPHHPALEIWLLKCSPHPLIMTEAAKSLIVVQSLSCVQLLLTPWTAVLQASLSFTISQSLLKLMSIKSVMLSNHLILCCPLLLLPSVFPIRVFSIESYKSLPNTNLPLPYCWHIPRIYVWNRNTIHNSFVCNKQTNGTQEENIG